MDADAQFARFVDILARRRRLIATISVCGTLAVGGLAWLQPTRYTAKAQIVVEDGRSLPVNGGGLIRDTSPDQATMLTEVTALSSDDLIIKVFEQLATDPAYQAIRGGTRTALMPRDGTAEQGGSLSHTLSNAVAPSLRWLSEHTWHRGSAERPSETSVSRLPPGLNIEEQRPRLKVFQELGSHVIAVSYTSTNPEESAAVVNKLVTYYVEEGDAQRRASLDRAIAGISGKISALKVEMESLEAQTAAYQTAHGLSDAAKTNVIDQKLGDLNRQLSEAQTDLAARTARRANFVALMEGAPDWDLFLSKLDMEGLVDLHNQAMALLQSRQDSVVVVSRTDRQPVSGKPMRDKVRPVLEKVAQKLTNEQNVAESRVEAIQQRLNAVQGASDDRKLRELVAASASVRHRFEYMVRRHDELVEQRDGLPSNARLLSRASVPSRPSSPNPLLFIPPGAIAFMVLGCMVALIRDRMEPALHSESDVRAILGINCAGLVPLLPRGLARGGASRQLPNAPASYLEAIRSIMVSLQLGFLHRTGPKTVLITSSVPDEGKTTLAVSLASYATRAGLRVLLLDLDPRETATPREATGLPHGNMPDLLKRETIQVDTMRTADGTDLAYLPVCRGIQGDLLPLFSGEHVSELLRRLGRGYDYIIIDSAPVLAVAEARILAAVADKILFVVRWGRTSRAEARGAMNLLRRTGRSYTEADEPISAVITQVNLKRHARGRHGDLGDALAKYGGYYKSGTELNNG
jgi:succinoglycan biosynthesis transport protein ExoP